MKSFQILAGFLSGSIRFAPSPVSAQCAGPSFDPPVIALIIDDIGYSRATVKRFLDIGIPLTFSILPALSKSNEIAHLVAAEKHESMLHQPMEPFDPHIDPGPGALYLNDSDAQIHRIINENIANVPFVTGINNHMGSKFTSHEKEMRATIHSIKQRHLFFIDSLTAHSSVAFQTACRLEVPALRRHVFLDNRPNEEAVYAQLCKLNNIARRIGYGIGIGHPHRATVSAIDRFSSSAESTGIQFVSTSQILFPPPSNSIDTIPAPL